MQIVPYLFFNGTCAEAFRFYEKALGGKVVEMLTHAETPAKDHVPPEWHDKIIHARLVIGDQAIMASDAPPAHQKQAQGISVSLHVKTEEEAERVFNALAEGGTVSMPMEKTFWSARFGMLTDRYGTPWMVNCESPPG
ncbi:MAG TPA: VOC family protein [Bauldia sp.]|nr:VOC family protein [Bauldia sp.]